MNPRWTFTVRASFTITDRGVGVLGSLEGSIVRTPAVGRIAGDPERRVPEVFVEFARVDGKEELALLLRGVEVADVPPGTVLTAAAE